MSETDLAQIESAWESASDADVLAALSSLTDYPRPVHPIIEAEATRRCISLDAAHVTDPSKPGAMRRGVAAGARLARARPFLATVVLGGALRALVMPATPYIALMHRGIWVALFVLACSSILLLTCYPWRSMRTVAWASLGGWLGNLLVSAGPFVANFEMVFWRNWYYTVFAILVASLLAWMVPCGIVCGVVWFRNRYRPLYPAGHCRQCGYNLRGLPVPRCSECGKSFDIKELQA